MSDLTSKWFFTDGRSRERGVEPTYRLRIRAVSGNPVPTDGLPLVSEPANDGTQLISLTGMTEFLACVEAWGCPVTVAPPESGELPWILELEDGLHEGSPLLEGLNHAA